ncbi:MAG: VCBS repeat-containing protein [Armatimonadetes bacterium]|nr:VCBS repeat-containing protein [Armatimonadota bacterium]
MACKRLLASLALISTLAAFWIAGCASSHQESVGSGTGGGPGGGVGTLVLNHVLPRVLTSSITAIRVTGRDAANAVKFGPQDFAPAATITIENVPVEVVLIEIDYLGNGVVIGSFSLAVAVVPGENTVITDPDWADVAPIPAQFAPAQNFAAGTVPFGLIAADFDGDGILDLAVTNNGSNDISILLGEGDGTFGAPTTFAVGTAPEGLAAADFNEDTILDLAVNNRDSNNVSILLGAGNGTFGAATNFATGGAAPEIGIVAADFDGDQNLDLAISNHDSGDVTVLLGNGDGTFDAASIFDSHQGTYGLAAADFNADGDLDLAATNHDFTDVAVFLGNGDGTFGNPTFLAAQTTPQAIAVADLDNDSVLDIAAANRLNGTISLFSGDGAGGFDAQQLVSQGTFGVSSPSAGLAAGDFNGDNRRDLAVTNSGENNVRLMLGNGHGLSVQVGGLPTGAEPNGLVTADFDRDGRLDLASANQVDNSVSVLLGLGAIPPQPVPLDVARLSVDAVGAQANPGSRLPSITDDKRFVVFESDATNLVPGDTNGVADIFLHDRSTGAVTRVSVDSAGAEADGASSHPRISGDGSVVVFQSGATNLVAGDANGKTDIFAYVVATGQVARVSQGAAAFVGDDAESLSPDVSDDGNTICYISHRNDGAGPIRLLVYNRAGDVTTDPSALFVVTDLQGVPDARPRISGDGSAVAFTSSSPLGGNDNNGRDDVYVMDTTTGDFTRVSIHFDGTDTTEDSGAASISTDGNLVAFATSATNMLDGFADNNNVRDVYVRNIANQTNTRVSVSSNGGQILQDAALETSISGNGRFATFATAAAGAVGDDTNAQQDVFVRDLTAEITLRASLGSMSEQGNGPSMNAFVSNDGTVVVFESEASNFVIGDTNGVADIFSRTFP